MFEPGQAALKTGIPRHNVYGHNLHQNYANPLPVCLRWFRQYFDRR